MESRTDLGSEPGEGEHPHIARLPVAPVPGMGISDENVEPSLDFPREQQQAASRLFNSRSFRRLWFAQVVSSLGDWIGLIAVTALAARLGGESSGYAIAFVLMARMVPGFFLGPMAGVFADRLDRRKLMVICDLGRGGTMLMLPFVNTLWQLFLASLVLEIFTLLWMPAKEATVPQMVEPEFLPTANSLSLVAAYGTFPIGTALFALLAKVAEWGSTQEQLRSFSPDRFELAFYADAATFFLSSLLIFGLTIEHKKREKAASRKVQFSETWKELREGLTFIRSSHRVRAVILALATGLIGGGMLVPLGPDLASVVLHAGDSGFALLQTALGTGVAAGVIGLLLFQRYLPLGKSFVAAVFGAGFSIALAASMHTLNMGVIFIGTLGLFAGAVYVLGFTILQSSVSDELRGRTFAALYTLVRLCMLLAMTASPALSNLLDDWLGGEVNFLGSEITLSGVRLTLWLGSVVIIAAGFIAAANLRAHRRAVDEVVVDA